MQAIGILRVVTCEEPHVGYREYLEKPDYLKGTCGEAWEEFRQEADAAVDNPGKAINCAVDRIKGR